LAHTNIIACAIFAATSGSSIATAAAIGAAGIPDMEKRGYDEKIVYGSLAAGGTLGILIPPSIHLIIYGAMVGESVGRLFMAALIPGVILAGIFMLYIAMRSVINPKLVPKNQLKTPLKTKLFGIIYIAPMVILIVVVLGGTFAGFVTPTESAAVGASGAIIIGLAYNRLNIHLLKTICSDTIKVTAMVMFILVGAQIMSYAVVQVGIAKQLVDLIISWQVSPNILLITLSVLYLAMGCFLDPLSMMLLTLPIIYPVIVAAGINLLWFGIFMVLMCELGMITPPVGLNLFVIANLTKGSKLSTVAIGALPYVGLILLLAIIIRNFPDLVLWLPSHMP
jgi:tripartite ATP-independent transporter DctM subunit